MSDAADKAKKKAAREAYKHFLKIGASVSTHQLTEKITEFSDEVKGGLRESLHAIVDHVVDNIEAYDFAQLGGSAMAGRNAIGQPVLQPVQGGKIQCNTSNFELVVKVQAPPPDASELITPPKRLV